MKWKLTEKQQADVREYLVRTFDNYYDVDGFSTGNAAYCAAKHFNFPDEEDEWDCEVIAEELYEEEWQRQESYWAKVFGIR